MIEGGVEERALVWGVCGVWDEGGEEGLLSYMQPYSRTCQPRSDLCHVYAVRPFSRTCHPRSDLFHVYSLVHALVTQEATDVTYTA